jgi:hypothetical protein
MIACDWQHIFYNLAVSICFEQVCAGLQRRSAAKFACTCGDHLSHYQQIQAEFIAFFEGKYEVMQLRLLC